MIIKSLTVRQLHASRSRSKLLFLRRLAHCMLTANSLLTDRDASLQLAWKLTTRILALAYNDKFSFPRTVNKYPQNNPVLLLANC